MVHTSGVVRFPGKVRSHFNHILALSHDALHVPSFLLLLRDARLITTFMVFVVLCEKPFTELSPFLEISFVSFGCSLLEILEGIIALLELFQLFSVTTFSIAGDSRMSLGYF